MQTLRSVTLPSGGQLELCAGDLAHLTSAESCDLIVVSAFPGDYTPTFGSLIGALDRRGLSVAALASDPQVDLRRTSSCWISRPIDRGRETVGFDQLMCYEPRTPGDAAQVVGNVFRALVPFVGPPPGIADVAMPILASGDQRQPAVAMLRATLSAAEHWMNYGLPLRRLRIVAYPPAHPVGPLVAAFEEFESKDRLPSPDPGTGSPDHEGAAVFVSYAHDDARGVVSDLAQHLRTKAPDVKVIVDEVDLEVGGYWRSDIARLMESSDVVLLVVTPGWVDSSHCQDEWNLAWALRNRRDKEVLFPIYALSLSGEVPLEIDALNYLDCREADRNKLGRACDRLLQRLG